MWGLRWKVEGMPTGFSLLSGTGGRQVGEPQLEDEALARGSGTCCVATPTLLACAPPPHPNSSIDQVVLARQLCGRAHKGGQRGQAAGGLGKRVVEITGGGLWWPRGHLSPCLGSPRSKLEGSQAQLGCQQVGPCLTGACHVGGLSWRTPCQAVGFILKLCRGMPCVGCRRFLEKWGRPVGGLARPQHTLLPGAPVRESRS